jgi:ribose transport system ATP-binding protein
MTTSTSVQPTISAQHISKTFGGRTVLNDFNLEIMPGEVHALVGQNGSGKSTFIKIIAGFYVPDENPEMSLRIRGEEVTFPMRAGESSRLDLSFVQQDLGLVDSATVLENLRVRNYNTGFAWRVRWRRERQYVRKLLAEFGVSVSPDRLIGSLNQVVKAQVAIARAFDQLRGVDNGLLVLDEPTPYLPRDGVDRIFQTVREVAARGVAVLFVSHRLEEVFDLTSNVTIIRDAKVVDCMPTASLTEETLIEKILGFKLDDLYPEGSVPAQAVAMTIDHVSGPEVSDVSFKLHRGEVLGITGLLGMGWDRLPYLLFGAERATDGTLTTDTTTVRLDTDMSCARAIEMGLALVPGNRLVDGSLQTATVRENLTLATLGTYYTKGLLRGRRERSKVRGVLHEYDVRPPDPDRAFSTLSGGNQQKVVLAKWFATNPSVLLLHEPTQGVDVGARAAIFKRIRDAAIDGCAVLLASSEYQDLPHICDRVIVMRSGQAVAELSGAALTHERIVEQSFRVGAKVAAAAG